MINLIFFCFKMCHNESFCGDRETFAYQESVNEIIDLLQGDKAKSAIFAYQGYPILKDTEYRTLNKDWRF